VIISEGLAAAVPPGHPLLSGPGPAKLTDLTGYPIVCLPAGTGVRAVLDQACADRGIRLNIALEASAPGTVADLAARGLGFAVLSETMAGAHAGRLCPVPLDDVGIPALLALVWKPDPGPAVQAFVRHCRRAF
jgi:DNA-binding transcriptional LysR family regulator